MHNIKLVRKNPDLFIKKIAERNIDIGLKDIKDIDERNRKLIQKKEKLEQEKKIISKAKDKSKFSRSKAISKEIEKIECVAKDLLEKNGYKQYEVSSWAKPGFESQHNLNYWRFGDFLGVGPGSHSKISKEQEIIRYRKIKPLQGYIKNQRSTDLRAICDNELDMDLAMNLLRIKNGLEKKDLTIYLPESFLEKYQKGVDEGLLLKNKIGTTQRGYKFLNETIQLFF